MMLYDKETAIEWIERNQAELGHVSSQKIEEIQVGPGLYVYDERQYGVSRIKIELDSILETKISMLETQMIEIEKTNKLLVKYIQEHINNR